MCSCRVAAETSFAALAQYLKFLKEDQRILFPEPLSSDPEVRGAASDPDWNWEAGSNTDRVSIYSVATVIRRRLTTNRPSQPEGIWGGKQKRRVSFQVHATDAMIVLIQISTMFTGASASWVVAGDLTGVPALCRQASTLHVSHVARKGGDESIPVRPLKP